MCICHWYNYVLVVFSLYIIIKVLGVSVLVKETAQTLEAFEFYYNLGDKRHKQAVANQFNVSLQTVKNWSNKYNWDDKLIERDTKNAKKAAELSDVTVVEVNKLMWAMLFKLGKQVYLDMGNKSVQQNCADISAVLGVYERLNSVGFNAGTEGNKEIMQANNTDTMQLATSMKNFMDKYDEGDISE